MIQRADMRRSNSRDAYFRSISRISLSGRVQTPTGRFLPEVEFHEGLTNNDIASQLTHLLQALMPLQLLTNLQTANVPKLSSDAVYMHIFVSTLSSSRASFGVLCYYLEIRRILVIKLRGSI